jgi:hypothetical protein
VSQSPSASESNVLLEERGFRYSIATEKFADAIVRLLSESFSREPMTAALGISARELEPLAARFMPEFTTNGLSVIAVPADDPDTLAGVFICRDFKSPIPEGFSDPWFNPIGAALMTVGEAYEAQRPGLTLGDAVDLWMVAVPPGGRFAKKGIASTLFRVSADLARSRGFKRCVTECTGYSRRPLPGRPVSKSVCAWLTEISDSKGARCSQGSSRRTRMSSSSSESSKARERAGGDALLASPPGCFD